MKTHMPQKLTRAQIKEGLDTIPIETLLMSGEGKKAKITHKQREFARAIALGQSKAQAYRVSHKANASKRTLNTEPYKLARDPRITREVEAYQLALEAEKHRTPAQLKALLVQQLVQHSLDDDFPPAQRMKALQLIGNLFEVGAFLERKESVIVHKSADIRARLLERLGISDVQAKDEGLTLLQEIRGDGISDASAHAPTAPVPAIEAVAVAVCTSHTVSDNQSLAPDILDKKDGVPPSEITDVISDFDKQ